MLRHPVQAEEGETSGGGGAVDATPAEATPPEATEAAPAESVASETAPEVETQAAPETAETVETPSEVAPGEEAAPETPAELEPEVKAEKTEEAETLEQRLAREYEAKLAEKDAANAQLQAELVERSFKARFTDARIKDEYRGFARFELGAIDPETDEGKAAIDKWAAAHPLMVQHDAPTGAPTDNEIEARRKSAAKGTAWEFLTPEFLNEMG